jgi:hypothetical protein
LPFFGTQVIAAHDEPTEKVSDVSSVQISSMVFGPHLSPTSDASGSIGGILQLLDGLDARPVDFAQVCNGYISFSCCLLAECELGVHSPIERRFPAFNPV